MKSLLLKKALPTVEKWLWPLNIALSASLLIALWRRGLAGRYRALSALLAMDVMRSLILYGLPFRKNAYGIVFIATEPLVWGTYAWVAYEAYGLVLESYRGISLLGRRSLTGALILSATVSILGSAPGVRLDGELYPMLLLTAAITQSVVVAVLLFLIILTGFMLWYPIPLRRNVVYYTMGFSLLFLGIGLSMFMRSAGGPTMARISSQLYMAVQAVCQIFWLFALRPQGETVSVAVGRLLHAGEQERLLTQLDSLNSILMQTAKRKAELQ
jgi:hypothetical protein